MKQNLTLRNLFVEDSAGYEYEVTADVTGPLDELDIFNVVLKSDEQTLKFDQVEDMPDIFPQDVLRKIYEEAEELVTNSNLKEVEY